MDIGRISMSMSQGALVTAVQISVMKLQMNTGEELAQGMNEMLQNIAVDSSKGMNLDARA